jgi:hypothetical protein
MYDMQVWSALKQERIPAPGYFILHGNKYFKNLLCFYMTDILEMSTTSGEPTQAAL